MTQDTTLALDNWLMPPFFENPYPTYKVLKERDPVHWNALMNNWIVTRYDDVQSMFQDRLARLESQIAVTELVKRFPDLHLTDTPVEWQFNITMRGLKALPLVF